MADEFVLRGVLGAHCFDEEQIRWETAAKVQAAAHPDALADAAALRKAAETFRVAEAHLESLRRALSERHTALVQQEVRVRTGKSSSTPTPSSAEGGRAANDGEADPHAVLSLEALGFRLKQAERDAAQKENAWLTLQERVHERASARYRTALDAQRREAAQAKQEAEAMRAAAVVRHATRQTASASSRPAAPAVGRSSRRALKDDEAVSASAAPPTTRTSESRPVVRINGILIKPLSQLPTGPSHSANNNNNNYIHPNDNTSRSPVPSTRSAAAPRPQSLLEYRGGELLPNLYRVQVRKTKHVRYEDDTDLEAFSARLEKRARLEEAAVVLQQEQQETLAHTLEENLPLVAGRARSEDTVVAPPLSASATSSTVSGWQPTEVFDVDALMEADDEVEVEELLQGVAQRTHSMRSSSMMEEHPRKPELSSEGPERTSTPRGRRGGEDANVEGPHSTSSASARVSSSTRDAPTAAAEGGGPRVVGPEVVTLAEGIRMPASIYARLLDFQQEGVQWLVQLHLRRSGGILGDEMGLGKTIQIASMLCALSHSHQLFGPVLLVAPVSVLQQWVIELHRWSPKTRVVVLHSAAGSSMSSSPAKMVEMVRGTTNTVLLTTFASMRRHCEVLQRAGFHYVILDEGHKISNATAGVTIAAKSFATPHRLLLTGTPIQNSLKELWCLFDFVSPGMLGTLNAFTSEFVEVISSSKNPRATRLVLSEAVEAAKVLQNRIAPFLLRRLKRQVNAQLPEKYERVIYVPLSEEQLDAYVCLLASTSVQRLIAQLSSFQALSGRLDRDFRDAAGSLHVAGRQFHVADKSKQSHLRFESFRIMLRLRQVCNHVDIYRHLAEGGGEEDVEGRNSCRSRGTPQEARNARTGVSFRSNLPPRLEGSGKLQTLQLMLLEWKRGQHRVLVFSQSRMMLDIIENLMETDGHRYIRMDGTTPVTQRQEMMDIFNQDASIFVALLTTRTGGVGVNLTGADRVVIFDPDWNPTTDAQARERSWRVGQRRDVCVYRLITLGTVEEFVLKRQLAKSYVTDKVLRDSSYQRFFHQESFIEGMLLGASYDERVAMRHKHVLLHRDPVVCERERQRHLQHSPGEGLLLQPEDLDGGGGGGDPSSPSFASSLPIAGREVVVNFDEFGVEAPEAFPDGSPTTSTSTTTKTGAQAVYAQLVEEVVRGAEAGATTEEEVLSPSSSFPGSPGGHACGVSSPTGAGECLSVLQNLVDGASVHEPVDQITQRLAAAQAARRMQRVLETSASASGQRTPGITPPIAPGSGRGRGRALPPESSRRSGRRRG